MDAVSEETMAYFEEKWENFEEVAGDIEDVLHAIIKDEVRSLIARPQCKTRQQVFR